MVSRRTEQRKLDASLAVALDPFLDLVGRPACGHSFDIGVRDSLDQAFHAAFSIGLLEDRDVFFPDVRFADAHLGTGDKGKLDRIELGGHLPADLVERFFVMPSPENFMSGPPSTSAQPLPAASAASLMILSAFSVYSGEQTALSTTPSPIWPARRSPVLRSEERRVGKEG